jgi:hypothetical protein
MRMLAMFSVLLLSRDMLLPLLLLLLSLPAADSQVSNVQRALSPE